MVATATEFGQNIPQSGRADCGNDFSNMLRVCLKNALRKMYVTICGEFCSNKGVVAGYGNQIRAKYTAKWGVQIVGMIFQTRSNTTKSRADIWKKFYMPAPLFIDSFILLLFCTVRFLRICILLFGCIRIVCCICCFRCTVIGLFYALT